MQGDYCRGVVKGDIAQGNIRRAKALFRIAYGLFHKLNCLLAHIAGAEGRGHGGIGVARNADCLANAVCPLADFGHVIENFRERHALFVLHGHCPKLVDKNLVGNNSGDGGSSVIAVFYVFPAHPRNGIAAKAAVCGRLEHAVSCGAHKVNGAVFLPKADKLRSHFVAAVLVKLRSTLRRDSLPIRISRGLCLLHKVGGGSAAHDDYIGLVLNLAAIGVAENNACVVNIFDSYAPRSAAGGFKPEVKAAVAVHGAAFEHISGKGLCLCVLNDAFNLSAKGIRKKKRVGAAVGGGYRNAHII